MYKIRQDRTVYTHSLLFEAARTALDEGNRSGSPYDYMHALVSAAFALEAYLNFAGESLIPFWSLIERVSTENKLAVICQQASVKPDFGKPPYQSLQELWRFRNFLAHARVESASEEWIQRESTVQEREYPKVGWERKCCRESATKIVEDVERIILELHEKAGLKEGALGMRSLSGGHISA